MCDHIYFGYGCWRFPGRCFRWCYSYGKLKSVIPTYSSDLLPTWYNNLSVMSISKNDYISENHLHSVHLVHLYDIYTDYILVRTVPMYLYVHLLLFCSPYAAFLFWCSYMAIRPLVMAITSGRQGINRYGCQSSLWSAEQGKYFSLSPFAPENLWCCETG